MHSTEPLLADIQSYATSLFLTHQHDGLVFHNLSHTEEVVEHCGQMADHYELSNDNRFILLAAAWFHDTGYLFGPAKGHEIISCEVCKEYFQSAGARSNLTDEISRYIMATQMPVDPKDLLERIICDADTYHFGTESFEQYDGKVKEEVRLNAKPMIGDWDMKTLELLKQHQFYTTYCRERLSAQKQANIEQIEARLGDFRISS